MDTPFDPTLENDIKQLLTEVPPPIRAFFASGKVETIAKNLMRKNKLHIDQGAVVEREIILLLLGLKDPAEFVKILSEEAKLDAQTVNSIVQDINTQIFIPLREEEMKSGGITAVEPVNPAPPRHIINKIQNPVVGEKLLEDHEEPHIEFAKAPMTSPVSRPTPPPFSPRPIMMPPAPPRPVTPPSNLPGAMPSAPPQPPRPVAPVKPYSSDPYREPIDEK